MIEKGQKRSYLSNSARYMIRQIFQVDLLALGTLYFAISLIFDLPAEEIVLGVIISMAAFVAIFVKETEEVGQMIVSMNEDGKKLYSLELDVDPEEIENLTEFRFKVKKEAPRT